MQGEQDEHLTGFFAHGIERTRKVSGSQYISICRFCGKKDKFYINMQSLLWDCKVCGRTGNFQSFLQQVAEQNREWITEAQLQALADNRGLPIHCFADWNIGFDGSKYTIPLYDFEGKITDLKMYTLGHQVFGTKGGKQSLIGAHKFKDFTGSAIYVCEGQWDTFALTWLADHLKQDVLVVGVPGANIFNENWIEYFAERDVYLCYDNDEPGAKGESKAYGLLEPITRSQYCLHWPSDKKEGYDVRDFVKFLALKKKKPKRAWARIHEMMETVPRTLKKFAGRDKDGNYTLEERRQEKLEPITFQELIKVYRKWLYIPDTTPIKILFANIYANRIPGEMLWMFIVGAPSSLKTELIRSLNLCPEVEMVTTLTPKTLMSGFIAPGKKDVSLLPLLNNRILAIQDYTSILSMNSIAREEIHGQLRSVYDGKMNSMFGHGTHRKWKGRFGIVAAVTASIEKFGVMQQTLGERFLRYVLPKEDEEEQIMAKLARATGNVSHEDTMRDEIAFAAKRYLSTHNPDMPDVPSELELKIHYLSRFTAMLRGFVDRDMRGTIMYKPDAESPMRLAKQLKKLGLGLACLEGKPEMTEDEFTILRNVAIGTCPGRVESIVRCLYRTSRPMQVTDITREIKFDAATVRIVLNDLLMLQLVRLEGGYRGYYFLSDLCKKLIDQGGVYPPALAVRLKKKIPTLPFKPGVVRPVVLGR